MTRSLKEFEIEMYEDRKAHEDYLMKEILSKPIIGMPKDEARIACFTSTSESDKGVEDWVWMTGYKGTALKTSIDDVDRSVKVQKLVGLGYSEAFATYACDKRGYEIACAMGSMPDVSMDVKVLAIMMDIR